MNAGFLLALCTLFGIAVGVHLGVLDGFAAAAVLFVLAPYAPRGGQ